MLARIQLRHLEAFHAVMMSGSITGAATLLHVTQPAVSATIKHFEQRLGFKLFRRQGGRLVPTPEARALLPEVQDIFGRVAGLERFSQDLAEGIHGSLSIAASSPIANAWLAQAVAEFVKTRPTVRVSLQSMDSNLITERLVNEQVDLGVAFSPGDHEGVQSLPMRNAELSCILPETHPLAALSSIAIDDLLPYPVITYVPQALLRHRLNAFIKRPLNIQIEVATSMTGMVLAFHGAGVALVESSLLSALPVQGLTSRPLKPEIQVHSHVLWSTLRPQTELSRAFVQHLLGA
ncbi:LysR family transcriptional regulator [Bordetella sp. BOR01]|uniref:LysR family transcriptional regulator n=1 Tax=Bordetella sp. BOR01 TaxID=2854779 RepID=UPI001C439C20|nr:LysR family transcriptional regulator [Bordetella sp. BOR01]MBV7482434.1 LysR family transcriptional regulator [Bordetella sp. BOR01]